jgi:hypothetical protein
VSAGLRLAASKWLRVALRRIAAATTL